MVLDLCRALALVAGDIDGADGVGVALAGNGGGVGPVGGGHGFARGRDALRLDITANTAAGGISNTVADGIATGAADGAAFHFETHNVPCKTNPLGVKGAGEAGAIGSCPAVVNAIVEGLWREYKIDHIDMPATAERVWIAIREHQRRHSL